MQLVIQRIAVGIAKEECQNERIHSAVRDGVYGTVSEKQRFNRRVIIYEVREPICLPEL